MDYTWDFGIFLQPAATGEGSYAAALLAGAGWTVLLSLLSWCLALLLATGVSVASLWPAKWAAWPARAFVNVFRNVPLLVQVFLWFYVVPDLLPEHIGMAIKGMDPALNQFLTVLLALVLFTAAKSSEVMRAGLQAVPKGQLEAAQAMGMTRAQAYRLVVLPQAARMALPPMTSELLNVFKNSAVAMTIGFMELTGRSRQMSEFTAQPFESFLAATLAYMSVSGVVLLAMRKVERRFGVAAVAA